MFAILGCVYGFEEYTYVESIHLTLEDANLYYKTFLWERPKDFRWVEFEFGEVMFDFDLAEKFHPENLRIKHRPKRKKKKI